MSTARAEFSSRFGFLMAASGSAVGLGNVWGFPTNAASNGGAAFLFTYLLLVFILGYPALMAELIIGRHTRSNAVGALQQLSRGPVSRALGFVVGVAGIITVSLILCFYSVVSGWMVAWMFGSLTGAFGLEGVTRWLTTDATPRNAIFAVVFMAATVYVVRAGVREGIEKWSSRLMPSLIVIMGLLIVYVLTLDGAMDGLRVYLVPDFSRLANPGLILSALGQAFFSLSLGVGTMLIYGSYISRQENLPVVGSMVALLDTGIACLAGLLVLPAMYVALANGVQIYDAGGALIAGPQLIVVVLPALFESMGTTGMIIAIPFFLLLVIASLTSSISMLEAPVAYAVEAHGVRRTRAVLVLGAVITAICLVIVFNFSLLFDLVVMITTEFSQPLLGLLFVVFAGWIWNRNSILEELRQGNEGVEHSLFWKIWPFYVRFICPVIIVAVYVQMIFF